MKKPPQTNRRRQNHKPNRLIPHKRPPLRDAPFLLGQLLLVRLNAGFDHVALIRHRLDTSQLTNTVTKRLDAC